MSRKRCKRRVMPSLPPRGLRRRLMPEQIRDLCMAHNVNLDDIRSGNANPEVMWQAFGGVLTWLHVAQALDRGAEEMQAQHDLMTRVVARYHATGAVLFTDAEYEVAKVGVMVMDTLAELVDAHTAGQCADRAEARTQQLQARAAAAATEGATA